MVKSSFGLLFRFGAPLFLCLISLKGVVSQGCYESKGLTCDPTTEIDSSGVDAQQVCYTLDSEYLGTDFLDLTKHADLLNEIAADSELCDQAQKVYHLCYWCDQDTSSWCLTNRNKECEIPQSVDETVNVEATCEDANRLSKAKQNAATIDLCYRFGQVLHKCPICGAPDENSSSTGDYLGADTEAKKIALIWVARASAILSFLGALFIIWDVVHSRQNRGKVYHQLLFAMACYDICTAVAWAFATAPIPEENDVYGAKGTEATCTAQGFFIQLGLTSVFYNMSLAYYYVLVIVDGWSEHRLKKIRLPLVLHGVPVLVGLGLACGGIPFYKYTSTSFGCYGDRDFILKFFTIPVSISVFSIAVCMLGVYLKVRRESRASRKWRVGLGTTDALERKVFWQCLLYALAFCITWPILLSGYLVLDTRDLYGLAVTVAFVAPLQGFNNFLVYVRPRWERYLEKRKKRKGKKGEATVVSRFSNFLWRRPQSTATATSTGYTVSSTGYTTSSTAQSEKSAVDPSVQIAERNAATGGSQGPGGTGQPVQDTTLPDVKEEEKKEEEEEIEPDEKEKGQA